MSQFLKKELLFLSAHLPSNKYPQAGHKIAYKKLYDLSKIYDIHLVCFINKDEKKYYYSEDYKFCKSVKIVFIRNGLRLLNSVSNLLLPVKLGIRANRGIKNYCISMAQINSIHFEYEEMICYLNAFNAEAYSSITIHDVLSQGVSRKFTNTKNLIRKLFYYVEWKRLLKYEAQNLNRVKEIIVLNEKDKQLLISNYIAPKIISVAIPSVVNYSDGVKKLDREKYSLLFVGALNRNENVDGIIWFIKNILPILEKKKQQFKLYVVGANPPKKILKLNSDNVLVTGFVEDLSAYYQRCHLSIAPLREGAGIKIKVLEALNSGLNVVATSVGAEGIVNRNLHVADNEAEFANKIIELFKHDLLN